MSIITARLNSDTDIYSGPGESYESIDHILSEGVLNVYYSEGDWYYVSCSPDYLVFNTDTVYGYVHGSVLTGMTGIPNDNLASTPHTGYEVTGYYGPDSNAYDMCATLPESQMVTVLWAEGAYYYIECVSDDDGMIRRMYIPQDSVDAFDGMPMTYTESYSDAELVHNTMGYTGPGEGYEMSGEITTDWAISKLEGTQENGFVLIEHPGDGNRYKRVWVDADALVIPNPDPVPEQPGGEGNEGGEDDTNEYVAMAITNNDSDIYSGPGEDYEIIDHIVAGETVGILSDEGDWCYIECPAGSLSFSSESLFGYIPTSVLDFNEPIPEPEPDPDPDPDPDPEPETPDPEPPTVPDLVTTTLDDTDTYSGPSSEWYEYCDHLPAGETITILWKEGDYYYVEATFMIYHYEGEGNEWYDVGTKRMYIHQDYVGSFTGTVPDLTNADYLEVDFTEDVMCYTGPGTNYESKGITSPGGPHTLLRRKSENGFALIDTVAYDNIGMRVWADTNKIILPDLVTYTIDETDGYYGPGSTSYDYCDHLPAGELVTILWKEGDWYYVYVEGDSFGNVNVKRRMYVHKDSVGSFTGEAPNNSTVQPAYALLSFDVSVVSGPAMVYEPIEYLDADTAVWQLGVSEENSCVFIEYTANSGLKRRGWVIKTAINGGDVLPKVAWDIMGTINTTTAGYYGPDVERYASAGINAIENTPVYVLWQEGDWYYINHPTNSSGEDPQYNTDPKKNELCTPSGYRKCFYVPTSCVTLESNISVPVHQENKINRPVAVNSDAYAGCGASYSFVGTAYTTDSVKWIDGLCRNGFAFIEYPISNGMYKRGWIPVSKFSDYSPSGFVRIESVRSGFKILEVEPQHIVLTNLGEKMSLKDSGFYGVNGGFFTFDRNSEIYNIATNNDISLLKSFDCFATGKVYDGGRSDSSRTMIAWTGSEIKVENFSMDDELTVDSYKTLNNIQYNTVWRQSGVNLQLGLRDDDYGIHSANQHNRMTVKKELIAQFYESEENKNGLYDDYKERTIMVADKVRNKILLIICTETKTIPDIRECLNDILDIPEDGTYCEDIVAICLDGGGSTAMRYSNNDSEGYLTPNRPLMQCIAIV